MYIVHEGSILQKALETFKNVFGAKVTYGIFNKDNSDLDADFIFAGNIKLSQSLHFFEPEEFDYIILDDERVIIRTKLEKPSKIKGLALI